MYLVLPDDKDGLDTLVRTINPFELRDHLNILNSVSVNLVMPKFSFDFAVELKQVLQEVSQKDDINRYASGLLLRTISNNRNLKTIKLIFPMIYNLQLIDRAEH